MEDYFVLGGRWRWTTEFLILSLSDFLKIYSATETKYLVVSRKITFKNVK